MSVEVFIYLFIYLFIVFNDWNKKDLKLQLLKEPFVFAGLVPLFELKFGLPLGLEFQRRISEGTLLDDSFVQGDVHRIPCWHEVTVVTNFHKRLALWPFGDFLLAELESIPATSHGFRDSLRCCHFSVLHDDHFVTDWSGPAPPSKDSYTCPF